MFCVNCGSALSAGAGPGAPAAPMYPGAMPGLPSAWESDRQKQIGRTKTGLLLLLIGFLMGWLPRIGIIGGLLILVGAILVILGRKAFGSTHARNVMISLLLVIIGIIGSIVLVAAFALTLFSAIGPNSNPQQLGAAFSSAFNNLLIGAIILSAISGLGSVLFTYALQNQTGKMLLWAGYVANIIIAIAIFAIISPLITNAVSQATSGSTVDTLPLLALQDQLNNYTLLNAIPSLLFAGACYLAWSRVNRGEIPAPTVPPGMPATPPAPLPPR